MAPRKKPAPRPAGQALDIEHLEAAFGRLQQLEASLWDAHGAAHVLKELDHVDNVVSAEAIRFLGRYLVKGTGHICSELTEVRSALKKGLGKDETAATEAAHA